VQIGWAAAHWKIGTLEVRDTGEGDFMWINFRNLQTTQTDGRSVIEKETLTCGRHTQVKFAAVTDKQDKLQR